jgi:hypothetical protein
METAYPVFNSLGALAGNLTIVSGCVTEGATVEDEALFLLRRIVGFKSKRQ